MAIGTLIVRADASSAIGHGHVMRCLALAQAWQDAGGEAIFASNRPPAAITERLRTERMQVECVHASAGGSEDAAQVVELAKAHKATRVVVDGYHFSAEYQRQIRHAGLKVLLVDDMGGGEYCADLVLNQNLHANEEMYARREPYTRLLLGTRYAMLRREFARWRDWKREISPVARKVLVTMGGGDPDNSTGRVVEALIGSPIEGLQAAVVIGGSNPHRESLGRLAAKAAGIVQIHQDVAGIGELMAWADVAISGAGSTCWEMCLLGLPMLLIDLADNQRPIAEELQGKGAAVHMGNLYDIPVEEITLKLEELLGRETRRAEMSHHAQELVDGEGAVRVVSSLRGAGLRLRRAEQADCRMLWEWANDPQVRAASFSPAPISWEQHQNWFAKKLVDGDIIYVATDEESRPLGQIRFDWMNEKHAKIDVSIVRERRGFQYGQALIEAGVEAVFRDAGLETLHALVKTENTSSQKAFEAAGFSRAGVEQVGDSVAIHFVRAKR